MTVKITNRDHSLLKKLVGFRDKNPVNVLQFLLKQLPKLKIREENIDAKRFPLLYAVNKGGNALGKVVIINPDKLNSKAKVVLVGKGVCYDSGGYYNKPYPSMGDMFYDKAGAMTVALYAEKSGLPAIIFLINNMISGSSMVNGEIIKSRSGVKVIVDHTDAEGRLGLADCLSLAQEVAPQAKAITVATLTGAASYFATPAQFGLLHCIDTDLQVKTLKTYYDKQLNLFPAPHSSIYIDEVKSKIKGADITNSWKHRGAGSQEGFAFLTYFHDKLIHLDIAALDSDSTGNPSGMGLEELDFVVNNA